MAAEGIDVVTFQDLAKLQYRNLISFQNKGLTSPLGYVNETRE
jgi:hypothetical protein